MIVGLNGIINYVCSFDRGHKSRYLRRGKVLIKPGLLLIKFRREKTCFWALSNRFIVIAGELFGINYYRFFAFSLKDLSSIIANKSD